MTIMTKDTIKANLDYDKESLNRFTRNSGGYDVICQQIDQRVRIYEDLFEKYESEKQAEEYCRNQISLFKACYGVTVPSSQAEFIINLYHEILGEEKEF